MSETRFLSTSLSPSQDLVQRAQSQCNRDSKRDITSWLPMAPRRSKSSKEKDTPTAEGWFLIDHRQRNGKVIKVCMCLCISGKVSFAWRLMSIIVVQLSLSRDATENFGLYCFGAPRGQNPIKTNLRNCRSYITCWKLWGLVPFFFSLSFFQCK